MEVFLESLQVALREGTYRPAAVKRQYIPKADGTLRPLGIPTVRDRVVQMATKLVMEPIFEADCRPCSFGFRPRRSATDALETLRKQAAWLKVGVFEDGIVRSAVAGTPQGGVISPLLVNIYLHVLDETWSRKYARLGSLVRYADDFVILCGSRRARDEAEKVVRRAFEYLKLQAVAAPGQDEAARPFMGERWLRLLGL